MSLRAALAGAAVLLAVAPIMAQAQTPGQPQAQQEPQPQAQQEPQPQAKQEQNDETLPIPPVPPRIEETPDYDRCIDMLPDDPSGAEALAEKLTGEAAAHCNALAQVELGNSAAGAALLDHLAATSTAPASSRAVVFGQADRAWTMAGDAPQAYASATKALALSPDDPELLIGHAIAALALQHCPEAAGDLTHALELDPRRADALTLRATANRCQNQLDQAAADIDHALTLDADSPDALLERGIIRQRHGNLDGAREDWQRAADLASGTPTGDLAEQNLALLEAGPRQ